LDIWISESPIPRVFGIGFEFSCADFVDMCGFVLRVGLLILFKEKVAGFNLQVFWDFGVVASFLEQLILRAIVLKTSGMIWHKYGWSFDHIHISNLIAIQSEERP
jgi:hypothetical protein